MTKVVISDASCLIALSSIDELEILKDLYNQVLITEEVAGEFGEDIPDWIFVKAPENQSKQTELELRLDKGEASSIALALETENSVLIIDEIKGRRIAQSLGVEIIGTIGVLLLSGKKGVRKDALALVLKMVGQGFRVSKELLEKLISELGAK